MNGKVDSVVSALDAVQDVRDALDGIRDALMYRRTAHPDDNHSYVLMCAIEQQTEKLAGVERWLDEANMVDRLVGRL